jgi:hypothetical protein
LSSPSSPVDPSAASKPKPTKRKRANARLLHKAQVVPQRGYLRKSEKSTIDAIIETSGELVPAQIDAVAIAMRREPATVERYINAARERFLSNADRYAEMHALAAERGLLLGDAKGLEVTRKASEFGMQNAGSKDNRVIEAAAQSSNAPVIKIGIALGGLPAKRDDE